MTDLITCATCGHDKSWHEEHGCTMRGCECLGFRSGDIADEEGDVEALATSTTKPFQVAGYVESEDLRDPDDGSTEPPYEPPPYDWEPGGGDSGGAGASGDV